MDYTKTLEDQNEELKQLLADTQKELEFVKDHLKNKLIFEYSVELSNEDNAGDYLNESRELPRFMFKELFASFKKAKTFQEFKTAVLIASPFDFRRNDPGNIHMLEFNICGLKCKETKKVVDSEPQCMFRVRFSVTDTKNSKVKIESSFETWDVEPSRWALKHVK